MSDRLTILDIAARNGTDGLVGLIEEAVRAVPEFEQLPARTIQGTTYKTKVRKALPNVDFRKPNKGIKVSKSTYEQRLVQTFTLDPHWEVDKAVADADEDGWEVVLADEAVGHTMAALQRMGIQFYYGQRTAQGGSADGFPGLLDALTTEMTIDAGGSGNSCTSVWAVRAGRQDVQWVFGNEGQMVLSDPLLQRVTDANGDPFMAYVQQLTLYPGLQIGSIWSVGRIKKIDDTQTLNDDLLAQLLSKFPVGRKPDYFLMNRRALEQLRASRTATNATGEPAPIPDQAFGVPILVTDSIRDDEPDTL